MTMLSTTAWVVHDLGLASAFGGSLFGKLALEPAVHEVSDESERVRVEDRAWKRFSIWNTIGLAAIGVTWFTGRKMLSGREVSRVARGLTITKDALVGSAVGVGLATTILGRLLARAKERDLGQSSYGSGLATPSHEAHKLEKAVNVLGDIQLALTAGLLGVTSVLAMESSKSTKFGLRSRFLP
ncbi:MAG: putative rane protein [Myxococcales bacterium]|nr:putative rane protein [Myxococcales bacterium]